MRVCPKQVVLFREFEFRKAEANFGLHGPQSEAREEEGWFVRDNPKHE